MDKAQPSPLSSFGRLDMTLRKTPGLGIFIVIGLLGHFAQNGHTFAMWAFVAAVVFTIAEEYWPSISRAFTSTPARKTPHPPSA
jgi:hypothetical protein